MPVTRKASIPVPHSLAMKEDGGPQSKRHILFTAGLNPISCLNHKSIYKGGWGYPALIPPVAKQFYYQFLFNIIIILQFCCISLVFNTLLCHWSKTWSFLTDGYYSNCDQPLISRASFEADVWGHLHKPSILVFHSVALTSTQDLWCTCFLDCHKGKMWDLIFLFKRVISHVFFDNPVFFLLPHY